MSDGLTSKIARDNHVCLSQEIRPWGQKASSDTLSADEDYLEGGLGNDILYGGAQAAGSEDGVSDTLVGGAGNDTYYAGNNDFIVDTQGSDILNIARGGGGSSLVAAGTYQQTSISGSTYRNSAGLILIWNGSGDARLHYSPARSRGQKARFGPYALESGIRR